MAFLCAQSWHTHEIYHIYDQQSREQASRRHMIMHAHKMASPTQRCSIRFKRD